MPKVKTETTGEYVATESTDRVGEDGLITREIEIEGMKAYIQNRTTEELDADEAECRAFAEKVGFDRTKIMKYQPIYLAQKQLAEELADIL